MGGRTNRQVDKGTIDRPASGGLFISINRAEVFSSIVREGWCKMDLSRAGDLQSVKHAAFPANCDTVNVLVSETLTELTGDWFRCFFMIRWLDASQTRIKG
jgi:hypothetical protein